MSDKAQQPLGEEQIRAALREVRFPGYSRDIVSFGLIKTVAVNAGNDVEIGLELTTGNAAIPAQIESAARAALEALPGVGRVIVRMNTRQPAQTQPAAPPKIAGVKRIIAVGSGKGGVGKSTIAVNLACAMSQLGRRIGLLDADIYGPSVPKMLGTADRPTISDDKLDPVSKFGIELMSMALLLDNTQPVIWRGPMIMKAIQEFTQAVNWGRLDTLIVDLPPGTGDAQLSLAQTIALDGGVIVTTPQDVALEVARRGIAMFEKVNVRILGIVENMSHYECPHCGKRDDVFGHGGARREAERLEVAFLGEIPLHTEIRVSGDSGLPVVVSVPDGPAARAFRGCAEAVVKQLEKDQK
jgi:ATP-binding protein involved in chromosome partitioning